MQCLTILPVDTLQLQFLILQSPECCQAITQQVQSLHLHMSKLSGNGGATLVESVQCSCHSLHEIHLVPSTTTNDASASGMASSSSSSWVALAGWLYYPCHPFDTMSHYQQDVLHTLGGNTGCIAMTQCGWSRCSTWYRTSINLSCGCESAIIAFRFVWLSF